MMNFEELLEKTFGKIQDTNERKQFPNFVIKGTKLIFVQNEDKDKDKDKSKDSVEHKVELNKSN